MQNKPEIKSNKQNQDNELDKLTTPEVKTENSNLNSTEFKFKLKDRDQAKIETENKVDFASKKTIDNFKGLKTPINQNSSMNVFSSKEKPPKSMFEEIINLAAKRIKQLELYLMNLLSRRDDINIQNSNDIAKSTNKKKDLSKKTKNLSKK